MECKKPSVPVFLKDPGDFALRQELTEVAIVDERTCLRQAMAASLRKKLKQKIIAVGNPNELAKSPLTNDKPEKVVVIYAAQSSHDRRVHADLAQLRFTYPSAKLILFCDSAYGLTAPHFQSLCIDGIVPSNYEFDQLLACIKAILTGIPFLPVCPCENSIYRTESENICTPLRQDSEKSDSSHSVHPCFEDVNQTDKSKYSGNDCDCGESLLGLLTPRQREVMEYILIGKSNKWIAAELNLCESTVKVHVHEMMKRLGATSRTHACYLINK